MATTRNQENVNEGKEVGWGGVSIGTCCRGTADKAAQASCLGMRLVDCDP